MEKMGTDYPLLQLQHYEEPQPVETAVQNNRISVFAVMTNFAETRQTGLVAHSEENRH